MALLEASLENELPEIQRYPSLREQFVQYCEELCNQVVATNKFLLQFDECIQRVRVIDDLQLQHLQDHHAKYAKIAWTFSTW